MAVINLISEKYERFSYCDQPNFRIGGGAMGEVFKGWKTDSPNEKVAIKRVYPRHAENPTIRSRAKYEASLSIDHPNLIKMLGYCEIPKSNGKGPIWIVSDFVNGNVISKIIETVEPSFKVVVASRMICSVCDALSCLHSQTPPVYHRDIKPSNIMVENGRNVRVMDLGIATSDGHSFGTIEGKGFGTYPYAPPEQILGHRDKVNQTSDIYSLGVTFYELLTNINPFAEGSDYDIIEKQVKMDLPYNDLIPKQLFKVISKATEKEQKNRYQSAEIFKLAIQNALAEPKPKNYLPIVAVASVVLSIILLLILLILKK